MRILTLILKDLSQILREKNALLFLLAMPLVFTIFMGFAINGGGVKDERLPLGWVNLDVDGDVSARLLEMLSTDETLRMVDLSRIPQNEWSKQIKAGKVAAVFVVPQGFNAAALSGKLAQMGLIADEISVSGQSIFQIVRVPVTRVMSSIEIARLSLANLDSSYSLSTSSRDWELLEGFNAAIQAWKENPGSVKIEIEKATGTPKTDTTGGNPYNQTSPGMLVQFAIFGLVTSAQILVQERKTHTLQRLITTNMHPAEIIAGHTLAMFAIVFLQQSVLVIFGQIFLGVDYLRQPLAVLLVMTGLGLWVACMGLLISVVARSDDQVVLFSLIAMFIFTGLGGAWFPLEGAGKAFAALGHFTPAAWAMDGFQNILLRGLGFTSSLLPGGILLLYALGFFCLAVWRFRKGGEG
ncbi:MAG TPA: ABC transporter permease [Anaerolineaceae bacterium]